LSSSKRELDEKDLKIIEILKKNSRASYGEIARRLGVSKAAVKKRLAKLVESGVIKSFTIDYDLGDAVKALILVKVAPGQDVPKVAAEIAKSASVDKVFEVAGEYDIVVLASTHSITRVNELIDMVRRTPGVATTNTLVVLKTW